MEKPSIQEMFNRAYLGLKSQNWEQCVDLGSGCCVYAKASVYRDQLLHCAWGWVDTNLTNESSTVDDVRGIASLLNADEMIFARNLQDAHDKACDPEEIKSRLENIAVTYKLTIPQS